MKSLLSTSSRNSWLVLGSLLGILITNADAQLTYTWNGSESNNSTSWDFVRIVINGSNRSNWSLNGPNASSTPDGGDTAIFPNASNRIVNLNGDRTIQAFNIAATNGYTFDSSATKGQNTLTISSSSLSSTSASATHTIWSNISFPADASIQVEDTLEIHGDINGTQSLTKTGAGTLSLQGEHAGPISVEAGRLEALDLQGEINLLAGGTLGAIDGTSDVTVGSVTGSGTITLGTGTLNTTLSPGGDGTIGTLNASGNLKLSGTYNCDYNRGGSDTIAVTGTLDITSVSLNLNRLARGVNRKVIATYSALTGTFTNDVNGEIDGFIIEYGATELAIRAIVPPNLHVDPDATGTGDGSSWDNAYTSLDAAMAEANFLFSSPDFTQQVWIKAGTYLPQSTTIAIIPPSRVHLYGGFAGTETELSQRDIEANLTIFSGDLGGDDNDPDNDGVIESPDDIVSGSGNFNATTIVSILGRTDVVLDGLVFTAGNAALTGDQRQNGGAIWSTGSAQFTVRNCEFVGNFADGGAAIWLEEGPVLTVEKSIFRNNKATGFGGAIATLRASVIAEGSEFYSNERGSVVLFRSVATASSFTNCIFAGNIGDNGGGFHNDAANTTLTNCLFSGNAPSTSATGASVVYTTESLTMTNCTVAGNNHPRSLRTRFAGQLEVNNTLIWGNTGNQTQGNASRQTYQSTLIEGVDLTATGTNNLDGTDSSNNPLFISAGDPTTAPALIGDYRIPQSSPAVDAGNNALNSTTTDLLGESRLVDTIDLGAYENSKAGPTIILSGDNPLRLECGSTYVSPGATAEDNVGSDLSSQIAIDTSALNINSLGTYSVTYSVTDGNNQTTQVSRTVNVEDATAPTIVVADQTRECNTTGGWNNANDLTVSLSDNCDTPVTLALNLSDDVGSFRALGDHTIIWTVTDSSGNEGSAIATLSIVDTTPPTLTLNGQATIVLDLGDSFADPGATVSDICDDDVSIIVGGDTVNTSTPGVYEITYDAVDDSSNAATQITRTIIVGSTNTVYVSNSLSITTDRGSAGLSENDTVTWTGLTATVTNLIYGLNAFDSIADAVAGVDSGGTVMIDSGLYSPAAAIDLTKSMTLKGEGARTTFLSGSTTHQIFRLTGTSTDVRIEDLVLTEGVATSGSGGAIEDVNGNNLTLSGLEISGNSAPRGGGISCGGRLIVGNSTFAFNASTTDGGAILFTGNQMDLFNTTISTNSAPNGAAIVSENSAVSTLYNNTIVANANSTSTVTIDVSSATAQLLMGNSIFIGNTGPASAAADEYNGVTIRPGNVRPFNGGTLNAVVSPILTNNNGGPTRTHALVAGSKAINFGNATFHPLDWTDQDGDGNTSELAPYDQRGPGFPRNSDGHLDSGAFEQDLAPVLTSSTPSTGSVGLPLDPEIVLNFDQPVVATSGNILIKKASDSSILATIPVTDAQVTVSGSTVTLIPSTSLPAATAILVEIPSGAIVDVSGNAFVGTTLTFNTIIPAAWVSKTFTITTDNGTIGAVDDGDVVTWKSGTSDEVTGLIFGFNAFDSIRTGVLAIASGGSVNIDSGTFTETDTIEIEKSLALKGCGADQTLISGGDTHRVIEIIAPELTDLITLQDLTITEGSAGAGGGIRCETFGLVQLFNLAVTESFGTHGGGIMVSGSEVVMANCTLSANTCTQRGAGIAFELNSTGTIINSTISGNAAENSGIGFSGGIDVSGSLLTLRNCTVTQNSAGGPRGGIRVVSGSCTIANSLVLGNTTGNADISGTFVSEGGNFIGVPGSATGFLPTDLTLASTGLSVSDVINTTLSDNGGPTLTHTLAAGSPALDLGVLSAVPDDLSDADNDNNTSEDAPFDQRGESRFIDGKPDSGAVEVDLVPALISSELISESSTNQIGLTFRQTVTFGSGNIIIRSQDGSTILATIAASTTTITGNTVLIALPNTLTAGTPFLVEIESGAFNSLTGLVYAGLSGNDALSFQLLYEIVYVAPADGFSPSNPTAGQSVTWSNYDFDATEVVSNLTFGLNAFSSVQEAVDRVAFDGTIKFAEGTYDEGSTVNIDRDVTLIGLPDYFTDFDAFDGYRIFSITGDANVTVDTMLFFSGDAETGAAINHESSGQLLLVDCEFTLSDSPLYNSANGTLTLMRCSLSRNTRNPAIINHGQLKVYNSTIGNNVGGIQNFGNAEILNATIVNNGTEGVDNETGATLTIGNSALTDNTTFDISGTFTSLGSNFIASAEITANLDASDLNYTNTSATDSSDVFTSPGGGGVVYFITSSSPLYNSGNSANIPPDIDDADGDLNTSEASPYQQWEYTQPRVEEGQVDIGAFELSVEPRLLSSVPARNSGGISPLSTISFTFDQNVFAGTGNFYFRDRYTDKILQTFAVTSNEVSFSGDTMTISPAGGLPDGYRFYLDIGPGVVLDSTGDDYSGTGSTFWRYTTCPLNIYMGEPSDFIVEEGDPNLLIEGVPVTWRGTNGNVTGLSFQRNAFVSLANAMNNACDGATLHFAAGTWNEAMSFDSYPVNIDKTVTLSGAGTNLTFIQAPDGGTALNITASGVVITGISIINQNPYTAWTTINYPGETDTSIIGFNADPNDTGITNGISFLTASNPDTYDPNSRAIITLSSGTLTYTMRRNSVVTTNFLEYSLDLNEWFPVTGVTGITVTETPNGFGTGVDRIQVEIDTSIHGECFVRQGITVP